MAKRLRGSSSPVLYTRGLSSPKMSKLATSVVRYTNAGAVGIAANMLGAPDMHSGPRLHFKLYEAIERADNLTRTCGDDGMLRSRQAIAAIIVAWELANPSEKALGD